MFLTHCPCLPVPVASCIPSQPPSLKRTAKLLLIVLQYIGNALFAAVSARWMKDTGGAKNRTDEMRSGLPHKYHGTRWHRLGVSGKIDHVSRSDSKVFSVCVCVQQWWACALHEISQTTTCCFAGGFGFETLRWVAIGCGSKQTPSPM